MLIPKAAPLPGWYASQNEHPFGVLTLITGHPLGRAMLAYQLRPWTAPSGERRLVAYRTPMAPAAVQCECAVLLQHPPATWRGLPTADAVAQAEARAEAQTVKYLCV